MNKVFLFSSIFLFCLFATSWASPRSQPKSLIDQAEIQPTQETTRKRKAGEPLEEGQVKKTRVAAPNSNEALEERNLTEKEKKRAYMKRYNAQDHVKKRKLEYNKELKKLESEKAKRRKANQSPEKTELRNEKDRNRLHNNPDAKKRKNARNRKCEWMKALLNKNPGKIKDFCRRIQFIQNDNLNLSGAQWFIVAFEQRVRDRKTEDPTIPKEDLNIQVISKMIDDHQLSPVPMKEAFDAIYKATEITDDPREDKDLGGDPQEKDEDKVR